MASAGPGNCPPKTPWGDPFAQHVSPSFTISECCSSEKPLPMRLSKSYSAVGVKKGRIQVVPGPCRGDGLCPGQPWPQAHLLPQLEVSPDVSTNPYCFGGEPR